MGRSNFTTCFAHARYCGLNCEPYSPPLEPQPEPEKGSAEWMANHEDIPHPIYSEDGAIVHDHPEPHQTAGASSDQGSTARQALNDVVDSLCGSGWGGSGCWWGNLASAWLNNIITLTDRD